MQPKALSAEAVQSQSSHLPADRLELEAVFAQLTPSPSQDKHTALYAYMHTVCHSPLQGHELHGLPQICTIETHYKLFLKHIANVFWLIHHEVDCIHPSARSVAASAWASVYVWRLYRFKLTDWLVTYSSTRRVAEPTILSVSWNWPHLDPRR